MASDELIPAAAPAAAPTKHVNHAPADEEPKHFAHSFWRGETMNLNPYRRDFGRDFFLERFVLRGWLPAEKPVTKDTRITAFGSCFAENITKHLRAMGHDMSQDRAPNVYISQMGEGMVNVYALLQQFEWALENRQPTGSLWHGYKAEQFGYDEEVRVATRELFLNTEFFIITLGLSEIWYDEVTKDVFWRAIPMNVYDASRHKFRVATFAESKAAIEKMYALIRRHVPQAKVLFTLSPISLAATFRPVSCITANAASKAILRAAVDEFVREHEADLNTRLFYFPSYEIIQELFLDGWHPDNRHPRAWLIEVVMKIFEATYCTDGCTLAEAQEVYRAARQRSAKEADAWGGRPPAPPA
jgi:hypothetical protein